MKKSIEENIKENKNKENMKKTKIVIIVSVAILVILLVLALLYFVFFNKKNQSISNASNNASNLTNNLDVSSQDYDITQAIKNISITSNITPDNYLIVIVKNSNNFSLYNVTVEVNFYNKDNKIIKKVKRTIDFLMNNSNYAIDFCCLVDNIDHYDFNVNIVKKNDERDLEYYDNNDIVSNIQNIKIIDVVANAEDKCIDFNIYNDSNITIDTIDVAIVYYSGDKIIGFDSIMEKDLESKKTKYSYFVLPYDINGNLLTYTSYKIIVNEAINYKDQLF